MSLDKAIQHGKEHRKEWHDSRAFDRTCRNHGDCPSCQMRRQYKNIKRRDAADATWEDLEKEDEEDDA
jgi:hypothetical protein